MAMKVMTAQKLLEETQHQLSKIKKQKRLEVKVAECYRPLVQAELKTNADAMKAIEAETLACIIAQEQTFARLLGVAEPAQGEQSVHPSINSYTSPPCITLS